MALLIILFAIIYVSTISTYKSLVAAGVDSKKALIPFINTMEWVRILGRPKYQAFVIYLPIFNFFLLFSFFTDLSRCFGKNSFSDYLKAMIIPIVHFSKIPNSSSYIGTTDKLPKEAKSTAREWADSILFAVLAATLIRWSTFEAFTIPTQSMEGTMLVGDYLFVSKLHYGPRSPITPLQVPLTHQNLWFTGSPDGTGGTKSYLDWVQLPYFRFPGITDIKRNDIVVFNWPWDNGKDTFAKFGSLAKADLRPKDLKTNYVKRCVAVGGDTLEVRKDKIIINGEVSDIPNSVIQHKFIFEIDSARFKSVMKPSNNPRDWENKLNKIKLSVVKEYGIYYGDVSIALAQYQNSYIADPQYGLHFVAATTDKIANKIGENILIKRVTRQYTGKGEPNFGGPLYPAEFSWTTDEYGPLVIPKKGMTIKVTKKNLIMFQRALDYFEGDNVRIGGELTSLLVDGKPVKEYTFKQNYYYMIGDNRHSSYDSRTWGFVPEDHVVGTPLLVWMSIEDNPTKGFLERIRWERIFKWIR